MEGVLRKSRLHFVPPTADNLGTVYKLSGDVIDIFAIHFAMYFKNRTLGSDSNSRLQLPLISGRAVRTTLTCTLNVPPEQYKAPAVGMRGFQPSHATFIHLFIPAVLESLQNKLRSK